MKCSAMAALMAGIVILGAGERHARAYCLHNYTGFKSHAKWKEMPVTYKVSSNASAEVVAAIDEAFQTWGSVSCSSLAFQNDGSFDIAGTDFNTHGYKGIYVFWFTEATGYPTDAQYVAYTFSGHDNDGGIVFGSVAMNAFGFKWNTTGGDAAGVLDVKNEAIYLIGTVLGLADSTATTTVMTPNIQFGNTDRHTLKQDDTTAIVYLYPKDATCTAPPPDGNCPGATPAGDGGTTPPTGDGSVAPPSGDGGGGQPGGDGGGGQPGGDGGGGGWDLGGAGAGDGASGGDDGGCSCELPATPAGALWGLTLVLGLGLAAARRRRR